MAELTDEELLALYGPPDATEVDLARLKLYNFEHDPSKLRADGRYDTIIGALDPFLGTLQQTTRMRAFCQITVAGIDITNKLKPHLISVHILDSSPVKRAEIEIDDRDGSMPLPPLGAPIFVALGWESEQMVAVFNGTIEDFEHGFGRKQGGRRMWVHAESNDGFQTAIKTPMQDHQGEGAPPGQKEGKMTGLPDWIQQMAKNANITADVDAAFDKIKSDSWMQAGESLMSTVQSLGQQYGFTHQFQDGNRLVVARKGHNGICCYAVWRDNLIAWRVRPLVTRSSFNRATQQWFDKEASHYNFNMQKFGLKFPFDANNNAYSPPGAAATETGANNDNSGSQEKAESQGEGNGRIIINGEPRAVWDGIVLLSGARPGVDGAYIIDVVEHVYSRQGFITTLEVTTDAAAPSAVNVGTAFLDLPRPAPNQG